MEEERWKSDDSRDAAAGRERSGIGGRAFGSALPRVGPAPGTPVSNPPPAADPVSLVSAKILLFSAKSEDRDALRSTLPDARVMWARSLRECVQALHGTAASLVFGDRGILSVSPWIVALLRAERLFTVVIRDASGPTPLVGERSVTRPLSQADLLAAWDDAGRFGAEHAPQGVDLSFAALLDEPVLAAGFEAMREYLERLADAEEPREKTALSALKVRAHALRTPAIALGFRRLEEACRELDEALDDATAARCYAGPVLTEARQVLGPTRTLAASARRSSNV
jgi:HPt (histidine-containing phosphotransfer) domain-containing protein